MLEGLPARLRGRVEEESRAYTQIYSVCRMSRGPPGLDDRARQGGDPPSELDLDTSAVKGP
jgi:hypothetical protein